VGDCDKPLLFALRVLGVWCSERSADYLAALAGHTQVSIWPGAVPDQQPVAGPEEITGGQQALVAWWVLCYHVSRPTMTVYSLRKDTGAAVVVFPGGGYEILAST